MNRRFPTRTGSLVLVMGLTGLARPAAAEPAPALKIVLQIAGHGSVPPNIVTRAKGEVTRIYRDAGVNVIWIDAASSTGRPDTMQSLAASDPGFALVILPREMTDQLSVAPDALGGAAGMPEHRGRMAYVFYNRVERIARAYLNTGRRRGNYDLDNVIVLGHAMAHEIGHLLLPYGHSPAGLMRADWAAQDMRLAVHGRLNFTSEQAELIRTRLLARPAERQSLDSKGFKSLDADGHVFEGPTAEAASTSERLLCSEALAFPVRPQYPPRVPGKEDDDVRAEQSGRSASLRGSLEPQEPVARR